MMYAHVYASNSRQITTEPYVQSEIGRLQVEVVGEINSSFFVLNWHAILHTFKLNDCDC